MVMIRCGSGKICGRVAFVGGDDDFKSVSFTRAYPPLWAMMVMRAIIRAVMKAASTVPVAPVFSYLFLWFLGKSYLTLPTLHWSRDQIAESLRTKYHPYITDTPRAH